MKIALIAQDGVKTDMFNLVADNLDFLIKHEFISTFGTAQILAPIGLNIVKTVNSGIDGGDIQIAGMVLNNEIDLVVFLTNVKDNFPHWYDAHSLTRVCIAENIPFACNVRTANIILKSMNGC